MTFARPMHAFIAAFKATFALECALKRCQKVWKTVDRSRVAHENWVDGCHLSTPIKPPGVQNASIPTQNSHVGGPIVIFGSPDW